MEENTLEYLLKEIIYKMNTVCDEMRELRANTVSKEEYETLQKQIEVLSLQVAKNTNLRKSHLLYLPQQASINTVQRESSHV